MKRTESLIGMRFGMLVVTGYAGLDKHGKRTWSCDCDCGGKNTVDSSRLTHGKARSCGCAVGAAATRRFSNSREPNFWARVDRKNDDECWNWMGLKKQSPKNPSPYGSLGWNGKVTGAHRVAFEIANGEIPKGMMVLHTCDNTLCCNPAHLYIGDHAQNMRDMVDRRRRKGAGSGQLNGRAKLTQNQASEIRAVYAAGGLSQDKIASMYGVSQFAISAIVRNKRYKEVQ